MHDINLTIRVRVARFIHRLITFVGMKLFYLSISFLLPLLAPSCQGDADNKAIGGELTVHYENKSDQKLAEELLIFWKENDLVTVEKQDIELKKMKAFYRVSMIAADTSLIEMMPFREKRLFNELKTKLWKEVFDEKDFELVISDDKFKPLYTVGE